MRDDLDRATAGAASGAAKAGDIRVAVLCGGIALGMLGMAYAAVPLYQLFCQVTGFGGTTQRAEAPSAMTLDRVITMRFDANTSAKLDWDFKAKEPSHQIKIGANRLATYVATNTSDKPLWGTATFNVTPDAAGVYFNKIECFCFTEQKLEPGETIEMPVSYFIDPEIINDIDTKHLSQITLSYTFFPLDKKTSEETAGGGVAGDPAG
ncbi:MAG: cytochrome c oxidase assembly protein [Pseudomonadota bacterium]